MRWIHNKEALVILGGWNPQILLNKKWLSRYIFPERKVEINLQISPTILPPVVSTDIMNMSLVGNKLGLIPQVATDDALDFIEDTATKLVDFLPHTPVTALGINYVFESQEKDTDSNWISSDCLARLATLGPIGEKTHRISINWTKDKDCTLNISAHYPVESAVIYELNFHYSLDTISLIKELFAERHILEYKKIAKEMIQEIITGTAEDGDTDV